MSLEEENLAHRLVLDGRKKLTVSGVREVESFDENTVVMSTGMGVLVIRGENLHIEALSLEGGDLKIDGDVDSLTYEEETVRGGGLLSRLFRG